MAHLWFEDSMTDTTEPKWGVWPLDDESAVPLCASRNREAAASCGTALLLCSRTADGVSWLIMSAASSGVALNGRPLRGGIRVLAERDEIRVAGFGRAYYSAERLATVELFGGAEMRIDCPRCKLEILAGSPVVSCPTCARMFHQSTDLPCWTYAERCSDGCPHPTALDAGYRWSPEGL